MHVAARSVVRNCTFVVLMLLGLGEASSGQRYVSLSGSDSAAGTFLYPWRTIQHAADHALPNDTVFIRSGTYVERVSINVSGSDAAGYISFMPYENDSVFVSGDSISSPDIILIENQHYLRIVGLQIGNLIIPDTTNIFTGGAGIRVKGDCQHISITDNVISDISGIRPQGIALYGDAEPIRFVRITGNTIHTLLTDTINSSYGGSGIRIDGAADSIKIQYNTIHIIRARYDSLGGAMAISIYGRRGDAPVQRLLIDGNIVYECQPLRSEAVALSGNVTDFGILYNTVYRMNNIGIGLGGGYGVCPDPTLDAPRNGVVRGNRVYSCHSRLEDGYAAGIYIDGARNILVEANHALFNDIGIAVNAEQKGHVCDSVIVRSNMIWGNDRAGISVGADGISRHEGGEPDTSGIVLHCTIRNNTVFRNNRRLVGQGELSIEDSLFHSTISDNIFFGRTDTLVLCTSDLDNQDIRLDYNLWFTPYGPGLTTFRMNGYEGPDYPSYAEYRNATGMDVHSLFADPLFVDTSLTAPDLHLRRESPAINAGDSSYAPALDELDIDEENRLVELRIDIGADEYPTPLDVDETESGSLPFLFALEQNFPNPLNPTTTIRFQIPNPGFVSLNVYDILGRQMRALINESLGTGRYRITFEAEGLASGVYFYRLQSGSFNVTKRMVLIR